MDSLNVKDEIIENVFLDTPAGQSTKPAAIILRDVKFGLSVIGFLANFITILTIVITVGSKMKTSTKLVTSLAFSSMFIALFNIIMKFIHYTSQWTLWLNNQHYTGRGISGLSPFDEMDSEQDPESLYPDVAQALKDKLMKKVAEDFPATNNISFRNQSKEFDKLGGSFSFGRLTNGSFLKVYGYTKIDQSTLTNILSSLSIIPNITCVLNLFFITTALLIMVSKPLKYHLILSRGRVTVAVLLIWAFAFLVALVVYMIILRKSENGLANTILSVYLAIWYFTFALCFLLPIMYGIVLAIIFNRSRKFGTKNKKHSKACVTSFVIVITYILGYLPFIWDSLFMNVFGSNTGVPANELFQCIYAANTILDAFIHSVRMDEVKNGYKMMLGKIKSCCGKHS